MVLISQQMIEITRMMVVVGEILQKKDAANLGSLSTCHYHNPSIGFMLLNAYSESKRGTNGACILPCLPTRT